MNKNIQSPDADTLFEAILTLESVEECYNFFEDLCTVFEIKEFSKRFAVAGKLSRGSTYTEISDETRLSAATISRVNSCLKYGSGGYRLALERLKEKSK